MLRDHEGSVQITQQGKLEMNSVAQQAELSNRTTSCYFMVPTPEKKKNKQISSNNTPHGVHRISWHPLPNGCSLWCQSHCVSHKSAILWKWRGWDEHIIDTKQSQEADPVFAATGVTISKEIDPQCIQGQKGVMAKSREVASQLLNHLTFPLYLKSLTVPCIKK